MKYDVPNAHPEQLDAYLAEADAMLAGIRVATPTAEGEHHED